MFNMYAPIFELTPKMVTTIVTITLDNYCTLAWYLVWFLIWQGIPVYVKPRIYPSFFPDEDKESVVNKRGMCSRGIEILKYLVSKH